MNENVKSDQVTPVMTDDDLRANLTALENEVRKLLDGGGANKKCACVVMIAPGSLEPHSGMYYADVSRIGMISNLGGEENVMAFVHRVLAARGMLPEPTDADLELAGLRLQVLQLAGALRAAAKGQLQKVIQENAPASSTEEAPNAVA